MTLWQVIQIGTGAAFMLLGVLWIIAGLKLGAEFALKMVFDDQINHHKKLLDEVSRESERNEDDT